MYNETSNDITSYMLNPGNTRDKAIIIPYNFILDCSYHCRKKLRNGDRGSIISEEEREIIEKNIYSKSKDKLRKREAKIQKSLYYVQEIEPKYASKFMDKYFKTHDLHEKLEIIRELSKYKSEKIIEFFYSLMG